MGANGLSVTLDANLTANQLQEKFKELREEARYAYGHDTYSGSWYTIPRLVVLSETFPTAEAARESCYEQADKGTYACAARATRKVLVNPVTFDGRPWSHLSRVLVVDTYKVDEHDRYLVADQVPSRQRAKLLRLHVAAVEAEAAITRATRALRALADEWASLKTAPADLPTLKQMRDARRGVEKAQDAKAKADQLYEEYAAPIRERVYATKDDGTEWVIAGWAVS